MSRFDITIRFDLPDLETRNAVFARYAKQLSENERVELSAASESFSCRDIKDVCKHAERKWASKVVHEQAKIDQPVPISEYRECIKIRHRSNVQVDHRGGYGNDDENRGNSHHKQYKRGPIGGGDDNSIST
jgi:ATP-dependent 26S proteasome regulatory subunit